MRFDRLLNVARALRESPNPDEFSMEHFGSSCGTPMCALGHYAARRDLQQEFLLSSSGALQTKYGKDVWFDDDQMVRHFGISEEMADRLFGAEGCGNAETALEAAEFVERFVAILSKLSPEEREFVGL